MANVLTGLASDIQVAMETVGRGTYGLIPSVTINGGSEAAAQGQTVQSFTTIEGTINTAVTPAMIIPEGDANTVGTDSMTLDKVVNAQISFTGEERMFLDGGVGYSTVYGAIFQRKFQGMLATIEANLMSTCLLGASRAVGVAGTTPFAANTDLMVDARQVIMDNKMPVNEQNITLVMNSSAGSNMRKQAVLQDVARSGSDSLLRQGELLNLQGISIKESTEPVSHTSGTGAGYLVNLVAGFPVGATAITVDTGAGTILAGDVITFAGDTNKYVVARALAANVVTLAKPGLRQAATNNTAITVGAAFTGSPMVYAPAVELAIRPMASPAASAASDITTVVDPWTGIGFQVEVYGGYKKAMIDITAVYGAKVWTPDAVTMVLG